MMISSKQVLNRLGVHTAKVSQRSHTADHGISLALSRLAVLQGLAGSASDGLDCGGQGSRESAAACGATTFWKLAHR
jgi:hypothetical protein